MLHPRFLNNCTLASFITLPIFFFSFVHYFPHILVCVCARSSWKEAIKWRDDGRRWIIRIRIPDIPAPDSLSLSMCVCVFPSSSLPVRIGQHLAIYHWWHFFLSFFPPPTVRNDSCAPRSLRRLLTTIIFSLSLTLNARSRKALNDLIYTISFLYIRPCFPAFKKKKNSLFSLAVL